MDTSDQGHANRPRTRQGRYVARAETAERDAKACRLRVQGVSYDQIAQALGFRDRSGARRSVQRAIAAVVREDAGELVALEEQRLDDLTRAMQRVMLARHYVTSFGGKVALNPETGEPLVDAAPVIAAARELRMISESRRKLLGLDAPAKHRIDVITEEAIDAEMIRLHAEIAEQDRRLGEHRPPAIER